MRSPPGRIWSLPSVYLTVNVINKDKADQSDEQFFSISWLIFRYVWTPRLLPGHGRLHLGSNGLQGRTGVSLDYRFVLELMPMMWDLTGYKKVNQVSDQTLLNVLMLIMFTCHVWLLTGCEAKQVPHYTYCLPSLAAWLFLRNNDAM